jgi:Family of unknown function (DUF6527)
MRQIDTEFIPEVVEEDVLYVSYKYRVAIHLCACGCKGQVVTPLDEATGWILTKGANGPTLRPSIGNQQWKCKSHYYVTNGGIDWL